MKAISEKEAQIVRAAIHLNCIHCKYGYIPDYECIRNTFGLTSEEMRDIRDVVQTQK